jgi:hypothetical protein
VVILSGRLPAGAAAGPGASGGPGDGLLPVRAAGEFAGEVAAGRVPSVGVIRARLHVGHPRAQRVRAYPAALSNPYEQHNTAADQAEGAKLPASNRLIRPRQPFCGGLRG